MKCPTCGDKIIVKAGVKVLKSGTWQLHQCKVCGYVFKGKRLKTSSK